MASIGILGGTGWLGRALGRDGISVARFGPGARQAGPAPGPKRPRNRAIARGSGARPV